MSKTVDIKKQVTEMSRVMDMIIGHRSDELPSEGFFQGWPGYGDNFKCGDGIDSVKFVHHQENCETAVTFIDGNYTSLPWAAMPFLFEIYKGLFSTNKEGVNDETKFTTNAPMYLPAHLVESKDIYDGIQSSLPWAFFMYDWDEDPDFTICTCPLSEWKNTMRFKNDRIKRFVRDTAGNVKHHARLYIGTIKHGAIDIERADVYGAWRADIIDKLSEGYTPVTLHAMQDEDEVNSGVIYWMAKKGEYYHG